jgi:hypothetical protein
MSEKIQTKKQELLDEVVAEIKMLVNQRMDNEFEKFIQSMYLLRQDQISALLGDQVNNLLKEYVKLK